MTTKADSGYSETSKRMIELASQQNGFLGVETVKEELGITVSYWKDLASIKHWKNNTEHSFARKKGKTDWYSSFKIRIAIVERDYGFEKE